MARIPLDFNAVDDKAFPTYPPGRYRLRVTEVRQEASKASGELVLKVTFEIVDGPSGSSEFAGKKIFGNYSLQLKAAFRAKRFLLAAGIPTEQLNEFDDEELVGREILANVKVEKYQGRDQNRVDNEDPADAAAPAAAVTPGTFTPPPSGFATPSANWGTSPVAGAPMPPPAKPING